MMNLLGIFKNTVHVYVSTRNYRKTEQKPFFPSSLGRARDQTRKSINKK